MKTFWKAMKISLDFATELQKQQFEKWGVAGVFI